MELAESNRVVRVGMVAAAALYFGFTMQAATSVAGKWAGSVDVHDSSSGSTISTPIQVEFKDRQEGGVSGKIGREGEPDAVEIRNGKIEGNHLTFEAASDETMGAMKFDLLLDGNHLEGQLRGAVEAQEILGKVKLDRAKD